MTRRFILPLLFVVVMANSAKAVEWARLDTDHFAIFFPASETNAAVQFGRGAEKIRRQVVDTLGHDYSGEIEVYLAPDRASFDALHGGGKVPSWAVATARPSQRTITMFSPSGALGEGLRGDMAETFAHELTHVAVYLYLGKRQPPRWLTEGLAQWVAGQWSVTDSWRMTMALLAARTIPLHELIRGWPQSAARAKLAYAQSLSLVDFLREKGLLAPLLRELRDGYPSKVALMRATGSGPAELEKRWLRYARRRHSWLLAIDRRFFYAVAGFAAMIGWMFTRRRRRERYERLDDDVPGGY